MKPTQTVYRRGDRKTSVAIRPDTHKKLKRRSVDLETHVSHLADQLISEGLKQQSKKRQAVA
jgi:hypothetical protein